MTGFAEGESVTLDLLKKKMAEFAKERDWDQFHSPRNLLLALVCSSFKTLKHVFLSSLMSFCVWPLLFDRCFSLLIICVIHEIGKIQINFLDSVLFPYFLSLSLWACEDLTEINIADSSWIVKQMGLHALQVGFLFLYVFNSF